MPRFDLEFSSFLDCLEILSFVNFGTTLPTFGFCYQIYLPFSFSRLDGNRFFFSKISWKKHTRYPPLFYCWCEDFEICTFSLGVILAMSNQNPFSQFFAGLSKYSAENFKIARSCFFFFCSGVLHSERCQDILSNNKKTCTCHFRVLHKRTISAPWLLQHSSGYSLDSLVKKKKPPTAF